MPGLVFVLLALANANCSSEVAALDIRFYSRWSKAHILGLTKTRRMGQPKKLHISPVTTLRLYIQRTKELREAEAINLFIGAQANKGSLLPLLKKVMDQMGINISIFSAYHIRPLRI